MFRENKYKRLRMVAPPRKLSKKPFAVNMLVNNDSGGTWTYEQYESWLEDAGFTVAPYTEVGENQLIKAHKHN